MIGHIFIYGYIGTNAGEVSVKSVRAQIQPIYDEYIMHIVSGGGDVFEGFGIYNTIKNLGKPVTAQIEGVCASITTLIAGSADKIVMNRTSQWMIHNPSISEAKGDSRAMKSIANQLDQIKTLLVNVYDKKTGLGKEKLWSLMDNETWLTAQEALQMGFADEVVDAIKAVATIKLNQMKENVFAKFWAFVKPKIKNQVEKTLEDGTAIIVMAEGDSLQGAQVLLATGEPLPAGTYTLQTGESITVDDNYVITEVTQPEAPENEQDMKKDEEIAALKAQLAALQQEKAASDAAVETAQTAETQAKAAQASFQNRFDIMEKQFKDLNEKAGKIVGAEPPKGKGPVIKNAKDLPSDPMGDYALSFYRNRNLINQNEED